MAGQAKLLRVLQTGELTRLGSTVTRVVDVRVISATNADLKRAMEERTFREDLYFRLNMIELVVPDLRDRLDDVTLLSRTFLEAAGAPGASFSPEAMSALLAHAWPGNVRELENRVKRAAIVAQDLVIGPDELGLPDGDSSPSRSESEPARVITRQDLEAALERHAGNITKAAADLGLSRQALYRRMEKLDLIAPERKTRP